MRLLLFFLTLILAGIFAAMGIMTFLGKIDTTTYIILSTLFLILLSFTSGHFIYFYYFHKK